MAGPLNSIHPLAGQGVNLGLMYAAALIEVLGEALSGGPVAGIAELKVLRRYERSRKSENLLALGLVDGLQRLFGSSSASLGWARRAGLGLIDRSVLAKRLLMGRALGTSGEIPKLAAT